MSSRIKTILAFLFFAGAITLPWVGMFVGWYQWDARTGLLIMATIFVVLFILGGLTLATIKDISWLGVSLPYAFGALYAILPDFIPLSVDDAAATTAGAIFSFVLALNKDEETPKWVFLPLLAAGVYTFLGGAIPGPVDEIIVDVLALIIAGVGTRQGRKKEITVVNE